MNSVAFAVSETINATEFGEGRDEERDDGKGVLS